MSLDLVVCSCVECVELSPCGCRGELSCCPANATSVVRPSPEVAVPQNYPANAKILALAG
jgi:hypothetical protein